MANELPMTVIDFVDGRARFGYAAEGRAVGPTLVRSGTVREKTSTDGREVASVERVVLARASLRRALDCRNCSSVIRCRSCSLSSARHVPL